MTKGIIETLSGMLSDSANKANRGIYDDERGMSEYRVYGGDDINDIAEKMAEIAARECVVSYCMFNGLQFNVSPGETAKSALARYWKASRIKQKRYEASPEGKAFRKMMAARARAHQKRHDASMACLPEKFIDHRAALIWIMEYADNSGWTYIKGKDYPKVIASCEASGYAKNANIDLPKDAYLDPDTMAGYVMGQALAGMYSGCMHDGMVIHMGKQALALLEQTP